MIQNTGNGKAKCLEDPELSAPIAHCSAIAIKERFLSPYAAAAIVASWNTTSTLIIFPSIFGKLGTLGGIVFVLLLQGIALLTTLHMIDLCKYFRDNHTPVERFSQLGERLFGSFGRKCFVFTQMANQVGVLVYAMVLMVNSIQVWFPGSSALQCNVNSCLIVIGCGYLLVQVSRDWKDFHLLAYFTLFLAMTMTLLLVSYCLSKDMSYGGATPLFVGMDYICDPKKSLVKCSEPKVQYGFLSVMGSLGSIMFSFAPCFIVCELVSEMQHPDRDAKKSLGMAFSFSTIVYILVGLAFSIHAGNQVPVAVQAHIFESNSWEAIISAVIIFIAMITDFVICLLTINRELLAVVRPEFDYEWTWRNSITWSWVTFIPCTLTFCLTIFIPNLEGVIGFVDAFSIPYSQLVLPCIFCFSYFTKQQRGYDDYKQPLMYQPMPLSTRQTILLTTAVVYGVIFSLIKIGIFCYNLTNLQFSDSYWCDQIAAL
mmetsp:Transcript_1823/g.3538  ORF Transcript_1823/g.3538 Transcript_1823/m.3538 type:complete len:484 (-) Transcript_1823:144-1595(-)